MTGHPHVIQGASPEDVEYVVARLRANDLQEAAAFGIDVAVVVPALVGLAADVYTARYRDRPVFIFGTVELLPGVRQLFGFGTDRTTRVMPAVTWFVETFWLAELFDHGVRRIQAHVPETNPASLGWLEDFGMYRECSMSDYAVDGVPMVQLAYTRNEYNDHVLDQDPRGTSRRDTRPREVERGHSV